MPTCCFPSLIRQRPWRDIHGGRTGWKFRDAREQAALQIPRDGRLVWRADTIAGSEQDSFPVQAPLAVDWTRGLIYLADITNRRIIKLIDRDYARQIKVQNEREEKLIALRALRATDEVATLTEAARLYEKAGSMPMAKSYWRQVQDADPGTGRLIRGSLP